MPLGFISVVIKRNTSYFATEELPLVDRGFPERFLAASVLLLISF